MDLATELIELCGHVDSVRAGMPVIIGKQCFDVNPNGTYRVRIKVGEMWILYRKECTETELIIIMAWAYKECI